MAKAKFSIFTLLIGILVGWTTGFFLALILANDYIQQEWMIGLVSAITIGFFSWLAIVRPKTMEFIGFILSFYIFFQAAWDRAVQDWNAIRATLLISSAFSFIVNLFSGQLRIGTAKKVARQALGAR